MSSTTAIPNDQERAHLKQLNELLSPRQVSAFTLAFVLLVPATLQAIVATTRLIPFIGDLIQSIWSVVVIWLWILLGSHFGEIAWGRLGLTRVAVRLFAVVVVTLAFVTPYVVGYYTAPIHVRRQLDLSPAQRSDATYDLIASVIRSRTRLDTGFGGVTGHAILVERQHLSSKAFGEFVGSQYAEAGEEGETGAFLGASINVLVYSIPVLIKLVLCDWLHWVNEAGFIGLSFWYIVTVLLMYFGDRRATAARTRAIWNLEAKRYGFIGIDPTEAASKFLRDEP